MMLYTSTLLQTLQSMLVRHLPLWGFGSDCRLSLLTVSENATFTVTAPDGQRCILRLYRPGYHGDDEIRSELQWMQALEETGVIRVPHIHPTAGGDLFVICEAAGRRWRLACFEYVSGLMPAVDETLPLWFEKLGAIAAHLHAHGCRWRKPGGFCRKRWTYETMAGPQAYWGDWRKVKNLPPGGEGLLARCDRVLAEQAGSLSMQDEDYVLLHGDLRPANLLVAGARLAVIDFDDCGFSWKALDFANAVSFMEDHPLVPELQRAWLAGYETVAPPSKTLLASIGLFIMLRRMQLTAWLATHAETPTACELGPGFVAGTVSLAENFLTNLRSAPHP